jgi:hypothetical protein
MGLDTKTYWLTDCRSQCDFWAVSEQNGDWRSTKEYNGVVEKLIWRSEQFLWCVQSEEDGSASDDDLCNCCNQLYKRPINSIIKSKPRLISHANPGYVTIRTGNINIFALSTTSLFHEQLQMVQMGNNEYNFCSWMHYARIAVRLRNCRSQQLSDYSQIVFNVTRKVRRIYYKRITAGEGGSVI